MANKKTSRTSKTKPPTTAVDVLTWVTKSKTRARSFTPQQVADHFGVEKQRAIALVAVLSRSGDITREDGGTYRA